jgi:C4-dicarboxylate-specific signal transduction histidine kinase
MVVAALVWLFLLTCAILVVPVWRRELMIAGSASAGALSWVWWVSRHTARELIALRMALQRIADGDLSPPAKMAASNREIADLQATFTTMAAHLRQAHLARDRQVEQERQMREMLQSLQLQVVRQERLAAVGVLVSGVAHELNNPLQAILGTVELLEASGDIGPAALGEVGFIKTQSGRAREIIRNLSRFSNQLSGPPSTIDLRDVISEVVQLRRQDLENSSIALDLEMSRDRKVLANFTEIEQVTLNCVINAQHAIESTGRNKGRILIKLGDAGKRVRLEVHDNGSGVTTGDEPKLFQPFFTTKPVGKGTGLGLSVSYGIIHSDGGSIGHQRNEWGGATCFFELPGLEIQPNDDRAPVLHRTVPPGI